MIQKKCRTLEIRRERRGGKEGLEEIWGKRDYRGD